MSKYNTEFKMKLVKEYHEGKKTIRVLINAYGSKGYNGLKVSRRNNSYYWTLI